MLIQSIAAAETATVIASDGYAYTMFSPSTFSNAQATCSVWQGQIAPYILGGPSATAFDVLCVTTQCWVYGAVLGRSTCHVLMVVLEPAKHVSCTPTSLP
jgi:hypothetical protein